MNATLTHQQKRILNLLAQRAPAEVSLPEILRLGVAQYNARIYELRRKGYTISSRITVINGERHTFFRLEGSRS